MTSHINQSEPCFPLLLYWHCLSPFVILASHSKFTDIKYISSSSKSVANLSKALSRSALTKYNWKLTFCLPGRLGQIQNLNYMFYSRKYIPKCREYNGGILYWSPCYLKYTVTEYQTQNIHCLSVVYLINETIWWDSLSMSGRYNAMRSRWWLRSCLTQGIHVFPGLDLNHQRPPMA